MAGLFLAVIIIFPANCFASLTLWAETGAYKVKRTDPATTNYAWDGNSIRINAAKNEFESFQVVLNPTSNTNLHAEISDFSGPDTIPKGNVKIYEVRYAGSIWPDPLVPLNSDITINSGQNTAIYFTVYIPKNVSAGRYSAEIKITTIDGMKTVPLHLEVWDFELPDAATPKTWFDTASSQSPSNPLVSAYNVTFLSPQYMAIEKNLMKKFKERRMSPGSVYSINMREDQGDIIVNQNDTATLNFNRVEPLLSYYLDDLKLGGFSFPFFGYEPLAFTTDNYPVMTESYKKKASSYLSQVAAYYKQHGWLDKSILYSIDEPMPYHSSITRLHDSPSYDFTRNYYEMIEAADPDIPILVAEQIEPMLLLQIPHNGIVWNPYSAYFQKKDSLVRLGQNEKTILLHCYANVAGDGAKLRSSFWDTYYVGAQGCGGWGSLYGFSSAWSAPQDGSLFYPGTQVGINDDVVISQRVEIIRDSIEDYEYLKLLENRANFAAAQSMASIIAQYSSSNTDTDIRPNVQINEDEIYKARERIAGKIAGENFVFDDLKQLTSSANATSQSDLQGSALPNDDGFYELGYKEPAVPVQDFENISAIAIARTYNLSHYGFAQDSTQRTQGNFSAKLTMGISAMSGDNEIHFSNFFTLTDWSAYDFLEFDVYAAPDNNVSLYNFRFWVLSGGAPSGENVIGDGWGSQLGHLSVDGAMPGEWHHIIAPLYGKKRDAINAVIFWAKRGGADVPAVPRDYVFYFDNFVLRKKSYNQNSEIVSKALNLGAPVALGKLECHLTYPKPANTQVTFQTRTGATSAYSPGAWSDWRDVINDDGASADIASPANKYLQYKAIFTSDGKNTPALSGVSITFSNDQPECGNGVKEIGENCLNCQEDAGCSAGQQCKNMACVPLAECVRMQDLMNYIGQWRIGQINMAVLMEKIRKWKTGEGC